MAPGTKTVITYGVFDVFHEGHRRLLERARALGDHLIVGITDNTYDELRGKLDTVDSFQTRAANVMATGFVDEVIVEDHIGQKIEDIIKRKADIFAIGSDWRGKYDYLRAYCEVVYLDRTPGFSSTQLREKRFPTLNLGILGSGRIARRFVPEAREVKHVNVHGVFNPRLESALLMQSQFKLEIATDSLDELFEAVDAVYIATPHETHVEYAKAALQAGKHVLSEKPFALKRSEAEELFRLAKTNDLVLLEAVKTAFCPGFVKIIELARSGRIGEIVDVESCFTKLTPAGCRERDDLQYGGSFLEMGSYVLLPALRLLGCRPKSVRFNVMHDENGIDLFTKAQLDYGDKFALCKTGLGVKSEGQLIISGTAGNIVVQAPWWKPGHCIVNYEDPSFSESFEYQFAGDGLRYEISEFAHLISKHDGRIEKLPVEESIAMANIIEEFLEKEGRNL